MINKQEYIIIDEFCKGNNIPEGQGIKTILYKFLIEYKKKSKFRGK